MCCYDEILVHVAACVILGWCVRVYCVCVCGVFVCVCLCVYVLCVFVCVFCVRYVCLCLCVVCVWCVCLCVCVWCVCVCVVCVCVVRGVCVCVCVCVLCGVKIYIKVIQYCFAERSDFSETNKKVAYYTLLHLAVYNSTTAVTLTLNPLYISTLIFSFILLSSSFPIHISTKNSVF